MEANIKMFLASRDLLHAATGSGWDHFVYVTDILENGRYHYWAVSECTKHLRDRILVHLTRPHDQELLRELANVMSMEDLDKFLDKLYALGVRRKILFFNATHA